MALIWLVHTYNHTREITYTGRKTKPDQYREFDDEASAHRWAKAQVEEGKCLTASIRKE